MQKLAGDLSLLGQISGELGLDDVSDLTSWECGQISAVLWSLQTKHAGDQTLLLLVACCHIRKQKLICLLTTVYYYEVKGNRL